MARLQAMTAEPPKMAENDGWTAVNDNQAAKNGRK